MALSGAVLTECCRAGVVTVTVKGVTWHECAECGAVL